MKTTDVAIDKVYLLLKGKIDNVYKLRKPTKSSHTNYVVINSLPISSGVLQKCYVNVNYHVKDLISGLADMKTLRTGTDLLMTNLQLYQEKGMIIEFENQQYFSESQLDEHYSNIRLSVKIINT